MVKINAQLWQLGGLPSERSVEGSAARRVSPRPVVQIFCDCTINDWIAIVLDLKQFWLYL
jgi:hypothetical protein